MAKKQKQEEAPAGSPAWMATFSDLMNLLLCFFVLLFSMSSIDQKRWEEVAASFNATFSIFSGGAQAIGDGILISNGVSQLNQLDDYINSTGKAAEDTDAPKENIMEEAEKQKMAASEELEEKVSEAVSEAGLDELVELSYTSQYVEMTLNGSLLFDSGSASLKKECLPLLSKVGDILKVYAGHSVQVIGHTDNVP